MCVFVYFFRHKPLKLDKWEPGIPSCIMWLFFSFFLNQIVAVFATLRENNQQQLQASLKRTKLQLFLDTVRHPLGENAKQALF